MIFGLFYNQCGQAADPIGVAGGPTYLRATTDDDWSAASLFNISKAIQSAMLLVWRTAAPTAPLPALNGALKSREALLNGAISKI
jgi:hypothetical protein